MGTNYYAHIIPTKERKDKLKQLIDDNNFEGIKRAVGEMYGRTTYPYWEEDETLVGGEVHLGKGSAGWKFLWNPNVYVQRNGHIEDGQYIPDPDTPIYLYPLTKEGIHDFIFREDVLIYDEYIKLQNKDEFWKMALEWTTWHGKEAWDSDSYNGKYPKTSYIWHSELSDLLEKEGYILSKDKSDFYSDGLRFATNTDFS